MKELWIAVGVKESEKTIYIASINPDRKVCSENGASELPGCPLCTFNLLANTQEKQRVLIKFFAELGFVAAEIENHIKGVVRLLRDVFRDIQEEKAHYKDN